MSRNHFVKPDPVSAWASTACYSSGKFWKEELLGPITTNDGALGRDGAQGTRMKFPGNYQLEI